MSFQIAFARLDSAKTAFFRKLRRPPAHEVIRFYRTDGRTCVCSVIQQKIGRKRHVAFIRMAAYAGDPAESIEGLASAASRDLGAPAASLTFWYVNQGEWEGRSTILKVEFAAFADGRFAGPRWIPQDMPRVLARQVERAQRTLSSSCTASVLGGRR